MPAQGSDLIMIERGDTLYKLTAAEMAALAAGGGSTERHINGGAPGQSYVGGFNINGGAPGG